MKLRPEGKTPKQFVLDLIDIAIAIETQGPDAQEGLDSLIQVVKSVVCDVYGYQETFLNRPEFTLTDIKARCLRMKTVAERLSDQFLN